MCLLHCNKNSVGVVFYFTPFGSFLFDLVSFMLPNFGCELLLVLYLRKLLFVALYLVYLYLFGRMIFVKPVLSVHNRRVGEPIEGWGQMERVLNEYDWCPVQFGLITGVV